MPSRIDDLLESIARSENELEAELARTRDHWQYHFDRGRVQFERGVRQAHERLRLSIPRFLRESSVAAVMTAPIIYSLILPIVLIDLWVTIYQFICFRVYGVAPVRRGRFMVIDRQHLAYLNGIEKLNCVCCGYANAVFAYVREVTGRTEQYWCPIRHAKRLRAPHAHYREFVDYGDAEGYRKRLMTLRSSLRKGGPCDEV